MTEDIVTGLSRFSYLSVIARGSTLRYTDQATDLRVVGKELGARYVMEGSLRQAGAKLRLAVQLVDAISGAHLWAENYERPFTRKRFRAAGRAGPEDRFDGCRHSRGSAPEHERGRARPRLPRH